MPEAAVDTAPTTPPPGGTTGAFDAVDPKIKGLMDSFVGIQEREMSEKARLSRGMTGTAHADSARAEKLLTAEGMGPDALPQKWDAEAEGRKHEYDPFQAFGSFGSVFGILASAFTHQPMDSALNASASAMQAVKAGKDEDYKRAYTAWKDNTELVIKRQNMIHQVYQDAIAKMHVDMEAGRMALEQAMVRFGDEKNLALFRAGYVPQVMEAIGNMAKANEGLTKSAESIFDSQQRTQAKMGLMSAEQEYKQVLEGYQQAQQSEDPGTAIGAQKRLQIAAQKVKQARDRMQEVQQITAPSHYESEPDRRARLVQNVKLDHPEWANDDLKVEEEVNRREALSKSGGAGHGASSPQAQTFNAFLKENLANVGPGKKFATEEAAYQDASDRARRTPMSAAEVARRQEHISGLQKAKDTIDNLQNLLHRIPFAVGMPGYATRFGEALGNVVGSNSTEYFQVKGDIQLLQSWANDQINLARKSGRALKMNESTLYSEIAGLNFGDTTPRVIDRYNRIRKLYDEFQHIESDILQGKWDNPVTQGAADKPAAEAPKTKPRWQDGIKTGG